MIVALFILFVIVSGICLFFHQPQFGGKASGQDLKRIQDSTSYKKGQFQNLNFTPQLTGDAGMFRVMKEFFFNKDKRNVPRSVLPSTKTDLFKLPPDDDVIIWFGHSSYFMQLNGRKFLVDPVLSGHASPVKFTTRSFRGSDIYTADDIPAIDFLLITHDHYDHLDHSTIIKLKPKIKQVITGLGVGAHLRRWGYDPAIIIEKDWNEEIQFEFFTINATPARHFSGRSFKRNTS
jgi:hypothetical protein